MHNSGILCTFIGLIKHMKKLLFILITIVILSSCQKHHCKRVVITEYNGHTMERTTISDSIMCDDEITNAKKMDKTYVEYPYGNGFYRVITFVTVY